ncbi:HIT domain-containing protein [Alteromonas flava]|uniref:HIT domain-containing protein n=1 Tax=Alteromonas flava TaxID=2048003 RepID=UPI000C28E8A8|nr:HIT domain-containing protein [Alteromonas flava]
MTKGFELDSRLANDCEHLHSLPLCELLLNKDANYPWLILVPRIAGATELLDLDDAEQLQLLRESNAISRFLQANFKPDKLNIAALGNVVKQLHIHHVARFVNDAAWPKPIWNAVPARPYNQAEVTKIKQQLQDYLTLKELV